MEPVELKMYYENIKGLRQTVNPLLISNQMSSHIELHVFDHLEELINQICIENVAKQIELEFEEQIGDI